MNEDKRKPKEGGVHFDGNRLGPKDDDRFGFGVVANLLADAATKQAGPECLVVGLEGDWGSGKSTLLSMCASELLERGVSTTPFAPWIIGSRDALLQLLFSALDKAVADQKLAGGDATDTTIEAARDSLAKFRAYSSAVAGFGRLAGLAGAVNLLPGGAIVEKAFKALADTMKEGFHEETLEDVKKRTATALGKLDRRIVVSIDDLDRLEPNEAVEVLRLVQAVADFPNVTYVLSYDRRRLAKSIETVTKLDGVAYLEKLIQVVVPLPLPQPVTLVDLFTRRLKELTGIEEFDDRMEKIVTNHIGPRIATPRGVVRVLDALKLLWPTLRDEVDLADLVWLQLVRAEDDRVYRWIEAYVAEVARPANDEARTAAKTRFTSSLEAILKDANGSAPDWSEIRPLLPLTGRTTSNKRVDELFVPNDAKDVLEKLHGRRLGSIAHARLYFGLLPPDGLTAQKELEGFLRMAGDGQAVAVRLVELAKHRSDDGPALVELVLDLVRRSLPQLSKAQLAGLSVGLLTAVDDLVRLAPVADRSIFRSTLSSLLNELSALMDEEEWSKVLDVALQGDAAVDILTAELPDAGEKRSFWMAAEPHAERVRVHLARIYSRAKDEAMMRFARHGRILKTWKLVDPDARQAFLDRVLSDDALIAELVLGLFDNRVTNQRQAIRELGGVFFASEIKDWFDLTLLKERLRNLSDVSDEEKRKISEIVNLLESTEEA